MKKKHNLLQNALFISLLTPLIAGCSFSSSSTLDTSEDEKAHKTIMIYMCGSDLESKFAAASSNISEMLKANIPDNVNVLIQTGGAKYWRHHNISNTHLSRYIIKDHQLELLQTLEDSSMGSASTLKGFMEYGYNMYPAEDTSIIFWDHGGASLNGVCFDEKHQFDSLTLKELDEVLYSVTKNRKKLDFVGFDACLMGNIETANIISKYADNMVASEDSEPLGGWDYSNWIYDYAMYDDYYTILADFETKCLKDHRSTYCLSHIDFEYYDDVISSYEILIDKIVSNNLKDNTIAVKNSLGFGEQFYKDKMSNLFDITDIATNLNVKELIRALSATVTYISGGYRGIAKGLAMYYPLNRVDKSLKNYLTLPVNQNYINYLKENFLISKENLIDINNFGTWENNKFIASISQESTKYLKDVSYKLFGYQKNAEGLVDDICLGFDADVDILNETSYSPHLSNKWVAFNNNFLYLTLIDSLDKIATFQTPIYVNDELATLSFSYDYNKHTFSIDGYKFDSLGDSYSRSFPLTDGDKITVLYLNKNSSNPDKLVKGETFIFKEDETKLEIKELNYEKYSCYIQFEDIFNNKYRTYSLVFSFKDGEINYLDISEDLINDSIIKG